MSDCTPRQHSMGCFFQSTCRMTSHPTIVASGLISVLPDFWVGFDGRKHRTGTSSLQRCGRYSILPCPVVPCRAVSKATTTSCHSCVARLCLIPEERWMVARNFFVGWIVGIERAFHRSADAFRCAELVEHPFLSPHHSLHGSHSVLPSQNYSRRSVDRSIDRSMISLQSPFPVHRRPRRWCLYLCLYLCLCLRLCLPGALEAARPRCGWFAFEPFGRSISSWT